MVAVVSRAQWGAAFGLSPNRVPPTARTWFVVHWPGGGVSADERAMVRNIERQHRLSLGWSAAPGYNYLVGQSGTIYEGCGRDIRGVHSPPRNADGWGVQVMTPMAGRPSQAALNSTRALYDWLCGVAGRRLNMGWHAQHVATACPGPDLIAWVRAGMPTTGAPAPPPPEEADLTPEEHTLLRQIHESIPMIRNIDANLAGTGFMWQWQADMLREIRRLAESIALSLSGTGFMWGWQAGMLRDIVAGVNTLLGEAGKPALQPAEAPVTPEDHEADAVEPPPTVELRAIETPTA